MNVTHVELPQGFMEAIGDKLEYLMQHRSDQDAKYAPIERANGHYVPEFPINVHNRLDQQFFKDGVYRCIEELSEATNCLKMRTHAQTEYVTDEEHFLEELTDATHYFLRLYTMLGLSAEDMVKLYFKKSEVNQFRRDSKY